MVNSVKQLRSQNQPLGWINNLRIIALSAVVMLHCNSPLLADYLKVSHEQWLVADFYNAITRFAVPVFVMITGALLLGKNEEILLFLKKRLSRIILPFVFWSLVYVAYAYYNEDIVYTGNTWLTVKQVLHQLKYGSSYHLWYVYMLLGLYLIIPILTKFVGNAREKEILYFLVVWLLVMLFDQPYLLRYNPQVDTRYFAGYIGYLVLGYYLANKSYANKHITLLTLSIFLSSVIIITTGTSLLFNFNKGISTWLYEPLSWPIVALSTSVFILFRLFQPGMPGIIITIRDFIGKYNYGIYLAHALVLTLLDDPDLTGFSLSYKSFNPLISIPLTALACFILSLLLVYLINKLPFIGKYISG